MQNIMQIQKDEYACIVRKHVSDSINAGAFGVQSHFFSSYFKWLYFWLF